MKVLLLLIILMQIAKSDDMKSLNLPSVLFVDSIVDIQTGYFTSPEVQDLLITTNYGAVGIGNGQKYRTGRYRMVKKHLLKNTNGEFTIAWESSPILVSGNPTGCLFPSVLITGDFVGDKRQEILEIQNGSAWLLDVSKNQGKFRRLESPSIQIGSAISWDHNHRGKDEIFALAYDIADPPETAVTTEGKLAKRNSLLECGILGSYTLSAAILQVRADTIDLIWQGLEKKVGRLTPIGEWAIVGKYPLLGMNFASPILREPQSDVSPSRFWAVEQGKDFFPSNTRRVLDGGRNSGPLEIFQFLRLQNGAPVVGGLFNSDIYNNGKGRVAKFKNGEWETISKCTEEHFPFFEKIRLRKHSNGFVYKKNGKIWFSEKEPMCK